jgi:hypothetical protein
VKRASLVMRRAERRSILTFDIWFFGVLLAEGRWRGIETRRKRKGKGISSL